MRLNRVPQIKAKDGLAWHDIDEARIHCAAKDYGTDCEILVSKPLL
jgi:hypothetical protein